MELEDSVTRPLLGVAAAVAVLLALPLLAMQVTDEVRWSLADFIVAGTLLGGTGLLYTLATRTTRGTVYRVAVGAALAAALMLVWANLAVGVIGTEDDPANRMYAGVLAVAGIGAAAARLRPRGMTVAMLATAAAQALVAAIALAAGLGAPVTGPMEIVVGNGLFVALWVGSALLFRAAARGRSDREPGTRGGGPGG